MSDISLSRHEDETELSARLDDLRIWHRVPASHPVQVRAEPFLVAALMGAMAAGEAIEVDPRFPVSPRLLRGIDRAQDILHSWNPALKKVEVRAVEAAPEPGPRESAAFFSGGVDGTYTLLKHSDEITHLIFVHGLEITLANQALFAESLRSNREIAARFGKTLVPVKTNMREFGSAHRISNYLYQGAILGSVALVLGFSRNFVGATFTYRDLFPWGSHPLLDPLWSTEASELIHDGAEARRSKKLARIAESPETLRSLRVCLKNTADYNCGRCEKCLRTMMTLRLLGKSTPALPPLRSTWSFRRLVVTRPSERVFLEDNYDLALQVGDRAAARALRACLRRYHLLRRLQSWDMRLLGGRLERALRRLVGRARSDKIDCQA